MTKIFPVIMSGGSGTRLWPLSRKSKPKQYLNLNGNSSLFEQTMARLSAAPDNIDVAPAIVICAEEHLSIIESRSTRCDHEIGSIILEPEGRNTAVVAGVAAEHITAIDPDALILLLPADHYVADPGKFWEYVLEGLVAASQKRLVTFGIKPTRSETGYGYIQCGEQISAQCYSVDAFKEKPDLARAQAYVDDGNYFWNAGIFLFSAQTMLTELGQYATDILENAKAAYMHARYDGCRIYLDPVSFGSCRSESIDYAVMERSSRAAAVAPVDIGWSDIGSWAALGELQQKENNASVASIGDVILADCSSTYIHSDGPLVAGIGLNNLIVVATADAVLVIPSDRAQDVKAIVSELNSRREYDLL